jgi:hypothetical protein
VSYIQTALEIINAKEPAKGLEKPPDSPYLMEALDYIERREWREQALQYTIDRLVELALQLEFIEALRRDRDLQMEVSLDIIRYGGRDCPWFLYLQEDDFLPERYPDCPPAKNYRMGSYFTGENYDEAIRFILDRANWAEILLQREVEVVVDFYHALEEWDFESELPPQTSDEFIFEAVQPWF